MNEIVLILFLLCLTVLIGYSINWLKFYFRCNGGFPQAAWDFYYGYGIVTGGNYGSKEVKYVLFIIIYISERSALK